MLILYQEKIYKKLRPLDIDELINRNIKISTDYIEKYNNKKVLVTELEVPLDQNYVDR